MALVLVRYIINKYIYVSYIFIYFLKSAVFSIVPDLNRGDKNDAYAIIKEKLI